jgi:tetratricopeptide (TPR) repeat protein
VAIEADSLSDQLFVSLKREKKANKFKARGEKVTVLSDTLWKYLAAQKGSTLEVSEGDSVKAIEAFNAGAKNLQELARLEKSAKKGISEEAVKVELLKLLQSARKNFEKAVVLNPFDLETRSWLARVYQSLAVRFLDENNHKKTVKVLENLTRLEKGEHTLFARLAESYYALEDWESAHRNFVKAEEVLRQARGLDFTERDYTQDVPLDTSALFYYVYYQGDTESKMHLADEALTSLRRAMTYASTEQEKADIQSYIDWINWDDGNIKGMEWRDKFMSLQAEGNYKEAAKGFRKLIPILKTRRAIDEIVWRLAILEFQYLDKKDDGIDRLKHVVLLAPKDENGAPVDSTYTKYFNSYGIMSHNMGLEYYSKNRKIAFTYFKQAVAIDWEQKAKSYLEIAKLSRNNPKAVIESCESALAASQQLNQNEQMQVYQLLVEAFKRLGEFDKARTYFAQWIDLRKSLRRSSSR